MAFFWKLFIIVASMIILQLATGECRNDLQLINNRYEGLIVGISDKTSQDHCNGVIHGLKVVLARFSSLMWEVTEGRASLGEVTVSLPRSWKTNSLTCSLLQPLQPASPSLHSHITVRGKHPLYGVDPWTQQSQGCGKHGDFIQLGANILRAVSNESHTRTAHKLLKQWIKFRWGVFDEMGREGDPLYPPFFIDPVNNKKRRNQCAGNPRLPFCEKENYIREAPTKHNALCKGRSAWEVIMQSVDFTNGRNLHSNTTSYQKPTFRFVQESFPRFVLAVEDTAVMNMQRRWEFVRKAVRRTVVYDVPDGTYMALVVFNSVAKTVAPLSKIDSISDVRQRIGSSLPRNPSTVPESHKCVMCGIQESLRALGDDAAGANIILVTSGSGASNRYQMDEITRILENSGVRITPVLYPLNEKLGSSESSVSTKLEPLINVNEAETGQMFIVIDDGVGNDSKVSMMVSLMDALLSAVRLSQPMSSPGTPIIIHSEVYPGGISSLSLGSFRLDESVDKAVRFSVYYYDLNHVGNTIQLTTPSGNIMASVNMQEEDGDANVIFVNIPDAERGIWKYKVENRADSHQGLHIQVTAHENINRKLTINLRTRSSEMHNGSQTIVYAEIKEDDFPIIGAQVQVKLKPLGSNETGYPYTPIYINLTDNGAGDPDITKGDGIYSRYLPQSQVFHRQYELIVIADHNNGLAMIPTINAFARPHRIYEEQHRKICCGNVLHYGHLRPVNPFRREMSQGVITLTPFSASSDVIPPSRILDLQFSINNLNVVTLRWTAPGNDLDWGRSESYEAILAHTWSQANAFEGEYIENLPLPHMAALEQTFNLNIPTYDEAYYVTMRAIDSNGNKGEVSNTLVILVPHPPTTRAPITTSSKDIPPSYSFEQYDTSYELPVKRFEFIAMLCGSILGLVIMFALILCYCYYSAKNRKQKHKTPKREGSQNIVIKTKSSPITSRHTMHESADSFEKDEEAFKEVRSLSPIQSWAPSRLLAEHERRYSVSNCHVYEQNVSINKGPYPDVTLNCSQSFPNSQTPSTNSDPPAYQHSYIADIYPPYPYGLHHQSFTSEELPPYSQGLPSQSSQESSIIPSDLAYTHEGTVPYNTHMMAYVIGDASYANIPPVIYECDATCSERILQNNPTGTKKVPPPIAPKPHSTIDVLTGNNGSPGEQKRRNITQV